MLTQRDLKREIYGRKDSLTIEKLFLSDEYGEFLTQMAEGVTECNFQVSSALFYSEDDSIAYTDGKKVNINYNSVLTKGLDKAQRHLLYCGLNLHECGHVLFTDFGLHDRILDEMAHGRIYPTPAKNAYLEALRGFIEIPGNYVYIRKLFHVLDNCIEDGFVDRAIMKQAPGYASCLRYVNQVDKSTNVLMYNDMLSEEMDTISIFMNLTLNYARHGLIMFPDDFHDELTDMFRQIIPYINDAVFEAYPLQRKKAVWTVFCYLFHFFDVQSKQQQAGDSKQNQGNEQGESQQNQFEAERKETADALKKLLKEAGENMINTEKSQHNKPCIPSNEVIKELSQKMKKGEKIPSPAIVPNAAPDSYLSELEKVAEKVIQSQICSQQEREIHSQMDCDIKTFLDGVKCHENVKGIAMRADVSTAAKAKYDSLHLELDVIVKRLLFEFEREIKERQLGDTLTGLYAGKRFSAKEAHRYDKRVMSRKIAPEDIPDMVAGFLLDLSESMKGERLETTIKCAYITYQFCSKLKIPCFIIGHTTSGNNVVLVNVCDERSLDKKDPLRIFSLTAHGCNRDGYAVWFCIKKLEKMTADQKLLMIISDGRPNHNGYGLESGRMDCQAAVKHGIKNGITTIAAAIGDSTGVRSVYKDEISEKSSAEFLDLTDLQKLPKAFVKIIKKHLK